MEEIVRQYLGLEDEQQNPNNCDPQTTLLRQGLNHRRSTSARNCDSVTRITSRTMSVRRKGGHFWASALILLLIQITRNVIHLFLYILILLLYRILALNFVRWFRVIPSDLPQKSNYLTDDVENWNTCEVVEKTVKWKSKKLIFSSQQNETENTKGA